MYALFFVKSCSSHHLGLVSSKLSPIGRVGSTLAKEDNMIGCRSLSKCLNVSKSISVFYSFFNVPVSS